MAQATGVALAQILVDALYGFGNTANLDRITSPAIRLIRISD